MVIRKSQTKNSILTPNFQYGLNEFTHPTQFESHAFDSAYYQPKTFHEQANNVTNLNIHPVNRTILTTQQNNQVVDMQNYHLAKRLKVKNQETVNKEISKISDSSIKRKLPLKRLISSSASPKIKKKMEVINNLKTCFDTNLKEKDLKS